MSRAAFSLAIHIAAEPEAVREVLTDLDGYPRIHPLVTAVDRLSTTSSADERTDHYRVHDRMKLGPLTISFAYRVEMSVTPAGDIVSDAYQFPRIRLHNVTTCRPEGNGSLVHEHVDIVAPRPLVATVHRKGLDAHRIMFERLKALLENG
ncbi:SRPBCC family protein [Nocardia paucivorans]|uniref:SRPBCC family protein n=1 Tax=Nocardia paucivorans TaxID=114259 RepID=UPI0002FE1E32|nr:SRPBCC family protein [Nocardia paucivorans]